MGASYIRNKLRIARLLGPHPATARFIPATRAFNRANLTEMAERYRMLYLKPTGGCQSRGIIRVTREAGGTYRIRSGSKSRTAANRASLYAALRSLTGDRRTIIQQGIDSEDKRGTHFDVRIHLLRIRHQWMIGGMAGRVAARNGIVAGLHRGGTAVSIDRLMDHHLGYSPAQKKKVKRRLTNASLQAVKVVSPKIPRKLEMAVDLGIDRNNRVWIFEVNVGRPAIRLFRFADRRVHRRLLALKRKAS